MAKKFVHVCISIHALREEGDTKSTAKKQTCTIFLSTPSARRATDNVAKCYAWVGISIHALREEGDLRNAIAVQQYYEAISIHALREEGDQANALALQEMQEFLSTPSARRATAG